MSTHIYLSFLLSVVLAGGSFAQGHSATSQKDEVLQMKPLAYWPADEGEGKVLHDVSGHDHHGTVYNVPWRKGGLIFENDLYQWVQVPYDEAFGSRTFSMGGWIYNGMNAPLPRSMYLKTAHEFAIKRSGIPDASAILIGQPFSWQPRKAYQDAFDLAKDKGALKWNSTARLAGGAVVRIFPDAALMVSQVGVASGKQDDVIDTLYRLYKSQPGSPDAKGVPIQPLKWHHVLYTYASGKGCLCLDGRVVKCMDDIPFEPIDTPLVMGGGNWAVPNGGTVSLDGSLRHMVYFDRALNASEVTQLCNATRPAHQPAVIPFSKLEARQARDAEKEKTYNATQLIARVTDKQLDELARGKAAMQVAAMKQEAKSAIPALVGELRQMTETDGAHLPKVEEFFRNALIRALLDIDRNDPEAQTILAAAFAKPLFDKLDTSKACFKDIRPLIEAGQYMEALTAYRAHMEALPALPKRTGWGSTKIAENLGTICKHLPLRDEYVDRYLSRDLPFRDQDYYAYNPYDSRDGTFYTTVVESVPFEEVERLFDEHLKELADKRPEREVTKANGKKLTRKWTRVKVVAISPDGKRKYAYLHGDWFIFDAHDEKMYGWSIIVDQQDNIHLLGGQHNTPDKNNYIPGSWEKLGIAKGGDRPSVMYWVSQKPNDITGFEFVGQQNNPRKAPGWMNYMNFARSRDGHMFLYGRGAVWTWAMLRYEETSRRWTPIKGSHVAMMNRAKKENPQWYANLGDTAPYHGPADGLAVAWQPAAYNYCRAWSGICKGVTFDLDNRMHLQLDLFGIREGGRASAALMYAYSDDLGDTFHRADGKRLHLPLTNNPIPSHNADQTVEPAKSHFDVWASLASELNGQ